MEMLLQFFKGLAALLLALLNVLAVVAFIAVFFSCAWYGSEIVEWFRYAQPKMVFLVFLGFSFFCALLGILAKE